MSEELSTAASAWRPNIGYRLRELVDTLRRKLQHALFRAAMALSKDGNLVEHAKRELRAIGYNPAQQEEDPNKWIQQNMLDLLRVFSMQGHSGHSAGYSVSTFEKLARFQPLGPLTGADEEWFDHGHCMQNKRCSHVFKQADRFNGRAYDLDGKVFREPNGSCFTNAESMVPIAFPYTPKIEYVDVPERGE